MCANYELCQIMVSTSTALNSLFRTIKGTTVFQSHWCPMNASIHTISPGGVVLLTSLTTLLTGTITGYPPAPEMSSDMFFGTQIVQSIFNYDDVDFDRIDENFNNMSIALTNYMARERGNAHERGRRNSRQRFSSSNRNSAAE